MICEKMVPEEKVWMRGGMDMKDKLMRLLSKKLVFGLAAGVVVLGVAVGIIAATVSDSPWKRVMDSIEKTVTVLKEQPLIADASDILDKGSVEVRMNTAELTYGLFNVDISAKLYSDIKGKALALVAGAAMNGTPFLDASAKLDEKMLVISSDAFLDEIYGLELQKAEAPDIQKEFEAFRKAAEKKIGKYLVESIEVEESEGMMSFASEDVAFDMITFRANGTEITEFLYNTAVYLKESEEFAQLTEAYAGYFGALYAQNSGTEQTLDRDDITKAVYDTLDMVINKKEEIRNELLGTKLCVRFLISEEDYLLCVETELEQGEEKLAFSVSAGPAPDRLREINVQAEVENKVYILNYAAEENKEKALCGKLEVAAGEEALARLQFEKSQANTSFVLELFEEGEKDSSFRAAGVILPQEDGSVIEVEELVLDSTEYNLGLGLTIKKEDSMPELPECTEVLPMETESVQRVFEDLTEELGELLGMFL